MFLKKIKDYFRQVGIKITLWYLLLLTVTTTGLFVIFYILYTQSLIKTEREVIEEKERIYEKIYREGGIDSIKSIIADQEKDLEFKSDFFVRIENNNGNILYFYPNNLKDFNKEEINDFFRINVRSLQKNTEWFYIKTMSKENDLEVHNKKMSDGNFIQVGIKVDDRDEVLEHFIELYVILLFIALILGWFGGIFLSSTILSPVRNLIETLKMMNKGSDKLRLKHVDTNDEMADLTEQFNIMLEHVEKTNASMRSTLDIISHELRTPLTSFRAMAEMALEKSNQDELKESVHELIEGIDEILGEFKMMMEITEMESGSINLKMESFDLMNLFSEILDLYEIVAEERNITIDLDTTRSINISGDRRKIKQALANLIDNAIKYSADTTTVSIRAIREDKQVQIMIIDQGIGITEEEIPLVFKRLYRGVNSRSQKGIGLGLSLVKTIIQAHNGKITVKSKINEGTTFTITLPL